MHYVTINEGKMAARPERVAISPLGVTCKGGLGKNCENPLAILGVVEAKRVGRNGDISLITSVLDNGRRRSSWMACSSCGPGYMI